MTRTSVAAAFALAIVLPRPAAADPINITSGSLEMSPTFGPIVLAGDRGFTFSSFVDVTSGVFLPWQNCNGDPLRCRPGASLSLAATWSGNDLTGTATLDGVTYAHVGSPSSPSSLIVNFDGSIVLPAMAANATVSAPFLFSGTFFHPGSTAVDIAEILAGRGMATLTFSPDAGFSGSWHVDHAIYVFSSAGSSPTPEPGTLFLTGGGLIGLGVMIRRRSSSRAAVGTRSAPPNNSSR